MDFEYYKTLPFANHTSKGRITKPISFPLEKKPESTVTLFPVHDYKEVPNNLLLVLQDEYNHVIEEGLTYPYQNTIDDLESFAKHWFCEFVAILIVGEHKSLNSPQLAELLKEQWKENFLGTFYIKPNYAGRCSHVCNAGFIVNHEKRGLGLGKEMGSKYLIWGKELGYVYSVFNLVFETNIASLKIWDSLGFERIGYVKNVAVLKGHEKFIGAYMFGKDLQ